MEIDKTRMSLNGPERKTWFHGRGESLVLDQSLTATVINGQKFPNDVYISLTGLDGEPDGNLVFEGGEIKSDPTIRIALEYKANDKGGAPRSFDVTFQRVNDIVTMSMAHLDIFACPDGDELTFAPDLFDATYEVADGGTCDAAYPFALKAAAGVYQYEVGRISLKQDGSITIHRAEGDPASADRLFNDLDFESNRGFHMTYLAEI